jgi:hypothetical protein
MLERSDLERGDIVPTVEVDLPLIGRVDAAMQLAR